MSITKSSCVTTLDKLAKKPYFQKDKLVMSNLISELKLISNFFINKIDVNSGVIKSAMAYPVPLKK